MLRPLVSVLVPTYNGERFLGAALESALAQTHEHLGFAAGDDASIDHRRPARRPRGRDPRVRVIRHDREMGAFETRSTCSGRPGAST